MNAIWNAAGLDEALIADEAEQKSAERRTFLGASDAAAVLGLSPWCTPLDLWQEKTGRTQPDHDPKKKRLFARGHRLEPFIRDMVIDQLREQRHEVELLACNQRYVDPEHPFLSAEVDFELALDGERINCDAKSVSGFARRKWGEVGTEDIPVEYAAQFQVGMMITGRSRCLVAALRSFDDVEIFWALRDEVTIAAMREKLVDFWINHVQADVPPEPVNIDDLKALFERDDGTVIDASQEIADKVAELATVKEQIKALEDRAEELTFQITDWIRPHATLRFNGSKIATWKAHERRSLDQKALAQAWPEIVKEFMRTTNVRVLRLS